MRRLLLLSILVLALTPTQAQAVPNKDYDWLEAASGAYNGTKTWADGSFGWFRLSPSNLSGNTQIEWEGTVYDSEGLPMVSGRWTIWPYQLDDPDRDITMTYEQHQLQWAHVDLLERHACFWTNHPRLCNEYHRVEIHADFQQHGWKGDEMILGDPSTGNYAVRRQAECRAQGTLKIDGRLVPGGVVRFGRTHCTMLWALHWGPEPAAP
jgi:hypothetical protein